MGKNDKKEKIRNYTEKAERFQERFENARKPEKKDEYQTKATYNKAKADLLSSQIHIRELREQKKKNKE